MYLFIDNYIFKRNLVETTLLPDGAYSMQISNYDEGEENKDLIKFIFHSPINPEATSNFYSHALFYVVSLKRTSKNMYHFTHRHSSKRENGIYAFVCPRKKYSSNAFIQADMKDNVTVLRKFKCWDGTDFVNIYFVKIKLSTRGKSLLIYFDNMHSSEIHSYYTFYRVESLFCQYKVTDIWPHYVHICDKNRKEYISL